MAEVTKDLREVQARLLEVIAKRTNAEAVLSRMEIRSPYAGKVVALNIFSVGGVIQRGEKIMDIVPDGDGLSIEAQVAVDEISDVHPGMRAEIHLTAFKQRIVPSLRGRVTQVSADRLNDPKTGSPYYVATIKPNLEELAGLDGVKLHPGMPATVMLPTDSRTAFEYIMGPLAASFRHSFKQK
jgi:HlyD family type I secretion membrane fusion protein